MKIKKISKNIIIPCLLILTSSCSAKKEIIKTYTQENKTGSYTYELKKSLLLNDPVIYGSISEFSSGEKLSAAVKVDLKKIYETNRSGEFMFNVKPGKHRFRGIRIMYKQVETKLFNISKGDSIKLVFKLKDDDTLLH